MSMNSFQYFLMGVATGFMLLWTILIYLGKKTGIIGDGHENKKPEEKD